MSKMLLAAAFTFISLAACAETPLEVFAKEIRAKAVPLEVVYDASKSCKTRVKVYGIPRAFDSDECKRFYYHLENRESWTLPNAEALPNRELGKLILSNSDLAAIIKMFKELNENLQYIKIQIDTFNAIHKQEK